MFQWTFYIVIGAIVSFGKFNHFALKLTTTFYDTGSYANRYDLLTAQYREQCGCK